MAVRPIGRVPHGAWESADLSDRLQETLPPVTMPAGIAVYPEHGKTAAEIVDAADGALYAAKRAGRNRTCVAA